jgi:hypothetical protein
MAALERFIVERDPGPLNLENWAGSFASDVPLHQATKEARPTLVVASRLAGSRPTVLL